jgi:nitroimidazol reductase NimA-like FMN-containing flavoprotein (pyridoxamine 5'-phosphate oxidase superfamily)
MENLNHEFNDLIAEGNARAFMVLAFLLTDGTPLTAPVWFLADGDSFLIGTDPSSIKAKAMRVRPSIAATILSEETQARYISIRGKAEELHGFDWFATYRRMVRKYEGREPKQPDTPHVFFRITPTRISAFDYRTLEV